MVTKKRPTGKATRKRSTRKTSTKFMTTADIENPVGFRDTPDLRDHVAGILPKQDPTFRISWWNPPDGVCPMRIIFKSVKRLGIEWYPSYHYCTQVGITWKSKTEAELKPLAPWHEVKAEWWRRLGWKLFGTR